MNEGTEPRPHQRRQRYAGKFPRRFDQKYKELDPAKHADTIGKVLASGKTPAGMHVPVMVDEILEILAPAPGMIGVDATLGFGGHAGHLLSRITPGGRLVGMDVDPLQLPRAEARLLGLGFGPEAFTAVRSNFAGLPKIVADHGPLDFFLADLGCSSMQIDDPSRGFTFKAAGPLDMRMNPQRGIPARQWLLRANPADLERALLDNADEPLAGTLAPLLAGRDFPTTLDLAAAIRAACPRSLPDESADKVIRKFFQAVRVAVNDEFGALDGLLRVLPDCLKPGGRAAFLTFHSGEDRRVKLAIRAGRGAGVFLDGECGPLTASPEECHANPRASSAKLRWCARR